MRYQRLSVSLVAAALLAGCERSPTEQANSTDLLIDAAPSGSVIEVAPTGTPVDLENVRAAVQAAQPGDVIRLTAGTFDFSDAVVLVDEQIDNRLCLRPHITIEGESGTVIQGPGRFYPQDPIEGFSLAFQGSHGWPCSGSGYDHVTIRDLVITDFTRGMDLAFDGAHNVEIESITFNNVQMGLVISGVLQSSRISGSSLSDGATGLYVNATWPWVQGPSDLLFDKNDINADDVGIQLVVHEPGDPSLLQGIRIERNKLSGLAGGIRVSSGDPLIAENEIEGHEFGVALRHWTEENTYSVSNATIRANRISLLEPVWWNSASIMLDHGAHDNLIVGNPILGMQGNLADIFLSSTTHDNVVRAPSPTLEIVDNGTNNQVSGTK